MKNDANTRTVAGRVLDAKRIWCVHINRRPLKATRGGGALFAYRVTFEFEADGRTHIRKKSSGFLPRSPLPGDPVTVTYNERRPEKCRISFK